MFRNAETGDKVWDFIYGYGKVLKVDKDELWVEFESFPIDKKRFYTFDGKLIGAGYPQTLFWDKIKFDIPFNLENELKKLKRKRYVFNENNAHFVWNNKFDTLEFFTNSICETFNMVYFEPNEDFMNFIKKVKENKVTREQFFKAYSDVFRGVIE